jgi:hypothetical protein
MAEHNIKVNRAPVLTLWATVVAERLGYDHDEALTLGRMVTSLDAQAKGKRLGIYKEHKERKEKKAEELKKKLKQGEVFLVQIVGRTVPAKMTDHGVRAVTEGKPVDPESVNRYLEKKFGPELRDVRAAMEKLAKTYSPEELTDEAYTLYEKFRPIIPGGKRGWGAQGELDLDYIRSLAG